MDCSPASIPSTTSSGTSKRPVHVPGTPKRESGAIWPGASLMSRLATAPIDPPRRRSSLFFSKVVQYTHPPKTPKESTVDSNNFVESDPRSRDTQSLTSPRSNVSRKRLPGPVTRSIAMPGHVAQMQKLFQSAKASFRLDVRFAASPDGSIDARLPTNPEKDLDGAENQPRAGDAFHRARPSKAWRYSRAPGSIAELDVDVREPFPDSSPELPVLHAAERDEADIQVVEPPSSGFTSPANDRHVAASPVHGSSPPPRRSKSNSDDNPGSHLSLRECHSPADLEAPMTGLRMSTDGDAESGSGTDSPTISHLKKRSGDVGSLRPPGLMMTASDQIMLSAPAKAAADSARVKRGLLGGVSPDPASQQAGDDRPSSTESHGLKRGNVTPCPDPLVHSRGPMIFCPDPGLHLTPGQANYAAGGCMITPSPDARIHRHCHRPAAAHPPLCFNRATATGSPMPLLKPSPPYAARAPARPPGGRRSPMPSGNIHAGHVLHHGGPGREPVSMANEHFQPGWYYSRDSPQPVARPGPAIYSFSTAAAKVIGQNPAPDSMIRDSYRTDTLTPLARPPSRFRKNGIIAMASARAPGNLHRVTTQRSRVPKGHQCGNESRPLAPADPRVSPPGSLAEPGPPSAPKKRSRDPDTPDYRSIRSGAGEAESVDPRLILEDGDEVIKVDEETSAAVRLSLYGGVSPSSCDTGSATDMKELSPNVVVWRKGHIDTSDRRKKRRPSYWDGDLEEVVRSPAARRVVSSPVGEDDVSSQRAQVEYDGEGICGLPDVAEVGPDRASTTPEGHPLAIETDPVERGDEVRECH